MRLLAVTVGLGLLVACGGNEREDHDFQALQGSDGPRVQLVTSSGEIVLRINEELAPITAENFLRYVDEGFYDGDDEDGATTFHRVISKFMIQGGGMRVDGTEKPTYDAIPLESDNGLSNWLSLIHI